MIPLCARRATVSSSSSITSALRPLASSHGLAMQRGAGLRTEARRRRRRSPLPQVKRKDPFAISKQTLPPPKLGVLRLDYQHPPQRGDIDHPESFPYPVIYRVVPGLTFEMCMRGEMSSEVMDEFIKAIRWLEKKGVSAITGDCGFMLWFQDLAGHYTDLPIALSSLCVLSSVTTAMCHHGKVAIFTANSESLETMHDLIKQKCSVETHEDKYVIVGCQDVAGFDPIFQGGKLDHIQAQEGIVAKALQVCREQPIRGIFFECTQLPPFSDAVRAATKKPVWDAITMADFFMSAVIDNPRFGLNDWHESWDGEFSSNMHGEEMCSESMQRLVFPDLAFEAWVSFAGKAERIAMQPKPSTV